MTNAEIAAALEELGVPYEVIFVNDGSKDRSLAVLRAIASNQLRRKWQRNIQMSSRERPLGRQGAPKAPIAGRS